MIFSIHSLFISFFLALEVFASVQKLEEPILRTGPARLPWEQAALKDERVETNLALIYQSIENNFSLTKIAEKQIEIASAREASARGAFDFRLQMQTGFLTEKYEQQILEGTLAKQLPGTPLEVFGGWRRGQGNFRPYEGKLLTGSGGEYRGGLKLPLLRDFLSDPSRTRLYTSGLLLSSEKENTRFKILEIKRIASERYWEWVGAYFKLESTYKLYQLANERWSQVNRRVKAGGAAQIEVTEFERMIAQRKAQLIEAERAYQKYSLDLSLYYRDESGKPQNSMFISKRFDLAATISDDSFAAEDEAQVIQDALAVRGDLKALEKQEEAVDAEVRLSKIQTLPRLDAQFEYAVDRGLPKEGEKEFRGMLTLTFPLENRESRGNVIAAQARMDQLRLNKSFLSDQIKQDMMNLRSALVAAYHKAKIMLLDRELSEKLALAERKRFQDGLSSLLFVNIREQTANDSAIKAMDAMVDFQKTKVMYQVSRGLDPH